MSDRSPADALLRQGQHALNMVAHARALGHPVQPAEWRALEETVLRVLRDYEMRLALAQAESRRVARELDALRAKVDALKALGARLGPP